MTTAFLTKEEERFLDYIDDSVNELKLVQDAPDDIVELFEQYMARFEAIDEQDPGDL